MAIIEPSTGQVFLHKHPATATGANTALSNLASVAINTSLISDTDSTDDLGSSTIFWANAYVNILNLGATGAIDWNIAYGAGSASWLDTARGAALIKGRLDIDAGNVALNTFGLRIMGDWSAGNLNECLAIYDTSDVNNPNLIFSIGRATDSAQRATIQLPNASGNIKGSLDPNADSTYSLGLGSNYWLNTHTDKLWLNATATLAGATAGHLLFVGDLVPATDDVEWVGQLETPFKAIKGLIVKDTTNGKHYKLTVVSGVVTATALD